MDAGRRLLRFLARCVRLARAGLAAEAQSWEGVAPQGEPQAGERPPEQRRAGEASAPPSRR